MGVPTRAPIIYLCTYLYLGAYTALGGYMNVYSMKLILKTYSPVGHCESIKFQIPEENVQGNYNVLEIQPLGYINKEFEYLSSLSEGEYYQLLLPTPILSKVKTWYYVYIPKEYDPTIPIQRQDLGEAYVCTLGYTYINK